MPMARVAATRLKNQLLPLRLCYKQTVYTVNQEMSGRSNEVFQAGIELVGAPSKRADLEVLFLAIEGLSLCHISDFKLELGHAGFFKALCCEIGLTEEERESIRILIERKNYAALKDYLDTLGKPEAMILNKLPRLFGGPEVLESALKLCKSEKSLQILAYVKELYNDLCQGGLQENIIIDMGLVHRNEYYTGVIFRGFMGGSGDTVLSGGRYDNLLQEFGDPMEATGFGINIDSLAKCCFDDSVQKKVPDALVFGQKGSETKALLYVQSLVKQGLVCESSTAGNEEEAMAYAKQKGIQKLIVIDNQTEKECVVQ